MNGSRLFCTCLPVWPQADRLISLWPPLPQQDRRCCTWGVFEQKGVPVKNFNRRF